MDEAKWKAPLITRLISLVESVWQQKPKIVAIFVRWAVRIMKGLEIF